MFPKARVGGLLVRRLDDEVVIYDLETHEATCLSGFAAAVFELCDGTRDEAAIAAALPGADAADVAMALDRLRKAQLLAEVPAQARRDWSRRALSRRQALRGLGRGAGAVAAAGALVTSIAVPAAAQALSCMGEGESCTSQEDCCPGLSCAFRIGVEGATGNCRGPAGPRP